MCLQPIIRNFKKIDNVLHKWRIEYTYALHSAIALQVAYLLTQTPHPPLHSFTRQSHWGNWDFLVHILKRSIIVSRCFASFQAIAEMGSTVFRDTQPNSMILRQYADYWCAKSRNLANIHDGANPNNIYIKSIELPICHSLVGYYISEPRGYFTDTACKAQ